MPERFEKIPQHLQGAAVVAQAIQELGDAVRSERRGGTIAQATPLSESGCACGGRHDNYSKKSGEGSAGYGPITSKADATKTANTEAETNAQENVKADLQRQWNDIACEEGCHKDNVAPALKTTVAGHMVRDVPGKYYGGTIYSEAIATGTQTVSCKP